MTHTAILLTILATFLAMEGVAWSAHKYIMHGWGWGWHWKRMAGFQRQKMRSGAAWLRAHCRPIWRRLPNSICINKAFSRVQASHLAVTGA